MSQRAGGGVMLSVDRLRAPAPGVAAAAAVAAAAVTSTALEAKTEAADGGDGEAAAAVPEAVPGTDAAGHEGDPPRPPPQDSAPEAQSQSPRMASFVIVRGTAPRVSAAGALLLERLKVARGGRAWRLHTGPVVMVVLSGWCLLVVQSCALFDQSRVFFSRHRFSSHLSSPL